MNWQQIKEQSAGQKRLVLTLFLYRLFGKKMLYAIALMMGFFTFIFSKTVRNFSKKYFTVISDKTGLKPSLFNQLKHICSFAFSLADKILMFSGDFDTKDIMFENKEIQEQIHNDIIKRKGVFFIFCHTGNIELLQSFFLNNETNPDFNINIFLSNKQSQTFNDFLKSINKTFPVKTFIIEDIGLNTGIELKENLDNGDIVFMAGDRVAGNPEDKNIETTILSKKVILPKGTFRLAKLMGVDTYFISAVKQNGKYIICPEKQSFKTEKELVENYTKYLERVILNNPFQFFNFFDFFN